MIIRMTVNDNDFTDKIESYLNYFWNYIGETEKINKLDLNSDFFKLNKKINNILNPNNDCILQKEDKLFLINQIKESFSWWCKKRLQNDDSDYLIKSLDIKILNSFIDKWENGEVCYWFQHSNRTITQ